MRKFLIVVGAATMLLIVAGAVGLFFMFRDGAVLDSESKAYAEDSLTTIASTWNRDAFLERASPAMRANISPDQVKKLFDAFVAGLGRLAEYDPPLGQANVMMTVGQGKIVTANYIVNARFDKGPAVVRITVIKSEGRWMLQGFFVDSPALINNLMGRPS
jgi:hypothetical protein